MGVITEEKEYGGVKLVFTEYVFFDRSKLLTPDHVVLKTKRTNPDFDANKEFEKKQELFLSSVNRRYGRFRESSQHPTNFVAGYGSNDVFFEYFFDGVSSTEFVKVVEGRTNNGRQALDVLEYLISDELQTIPEKISLVSIPFSSYEAGHKPFRCATFSAKLRINRIITDRHLFYIAER